MRPVDDNTAKALGGSRTGDTLIVRAWYAGSPAWPEPLRLSGWSLSWDASRTSQSLHLKAEDPSGKLAPWLLEDPLGVGGARLTVQYAVGGASVVDLGVYRITRSDPSEKWAAYTVAEDGTVVKDSALAPGYRIIEVPMGATIEVDADDIGIVAEASRFIAPESPQGASPTIVGEIQRILTDICPVVAMSGVTDRGVNKSLVYEQQKGRWAVAQDLAKRIGCDVRMNGYGQCEVYPLAQSPALTLKGGPEGLLVQVARTQSYDGLYNVFVADGTATVNGQSVPVRGVAQIAAGPLRVGGPHGTVPKFYSSNMLTTQAEADAYAVQMRDTQLASLTTDVKVTCLPLPQLQVGDWVTLYQPKPDQRVAAPAGRVVAVGLSGNGTTVAAMTLTVRCSYADVQAAFTTDANLSIAGPATFNQSGIHTQTNPAAAAPTTLYPSGTLYPSSTLYPRS